MYWIFAISVIDWQPDQSGPRLSLCNTWDKPQSTSDPELEKMVKMMYGLILPSFIPVFLMMLFVHLSHNFTVIYFSNVESECAQQ